MSEPNPVDDEFLYNLIILGGVGSPGMVTLSGHDREIDWDIKTGPGQSGASTTLKAKKLVEFTASFYLADQEDFDNWPSFKELIESTVKGKGQALDIFHPDLAANGIKSVVLKSFGGVVHDKKGGQTIAVKFLEYSPPKKATVNPSGSKSKPKADPNAAANAELARLTAQYQATPWG